MSDLTSLHVASSNLGCYDINQLKEFRSVLMSLQYTTKTTGLSICQQLLELNDTVNVYPLIHTFKEWWKEWPLYSGDNIFPVPGVKGQSAPDCFVSEDRWSGTYGNNRRALAKFLFDRLNLYIEYIQDPSNLVMEDLQTCKAELERVIAAGGADGRTAICSLLHNVLHGLYGMDTRTIVVYQSTVMTICKDIMMVWPKYSGHSSYPVPVATGMCPRAMYDYAILNGLMWTGKYGELRMDLAKYLNDALGHVLHAMKIRLGEV